MALIECKHCGREISDKAERCPHCGEKVEEAGNTAERVCEECGAALKEEDEVCPVCGCPAGTAGQTEPTSRTEETSQTEQTGQAGQNVSGSGLQPETQAEKKKPGKGKYILIAVILLVLVIFGIAACGGSGDQAGQNDGSDGAAVSEEDGSEEDGQKEDGAGDQDKDGDKDSRETDGQVTAAQLYQMIAENGNYPFTVSETSIAFIDAHPEYFPGNAKIQGAISDYVNEEADYQHVAKNPSKYQDTLMNITGDVIDIKESDIDGQTVTAFHVYNEYDGRSYMVYHLGALENVFEGSWVWAYVLPFDMISFENMGGGYTEAIACGSCYVGGDAEPVE